MERSTPPEVSLIDYHSGISLYVKFNVLLDILVYPRILKDLTQRKQIGPTLRTQKNCLRGFAVETLQCNLLISNNTAGFAEFAGIFHRDWKKCQNRKERKRETKGIYLAMIL